MAIVTGDRYLEKLVKFVEQQAVPLIEGSIVLKLNPAGLHYVQSRLEALRELERLLAGAPVDYLRAYISDLGDHRALEQLRRILKLLTSLKVVSALPPPARDPTPLSLLPFGRLKVLELRGCDLSTSAAKGLLELRHTLEKIICHNSTDALRHVFACRIAEIKDCPQWNRLAFVSCSCNRLVLMDESLQLLPVVETLDLSRNRFAKIDNLRRCVKLKQLDLGFNHLRSVAAFSEVSYHIVKLVLRNNALTTLCGIENLKSLDALDISYNIISNFSELEFLDGLPSLLNLWLEGNPLCCSRWYRAQVFSYFKYADKLKLDDKEISTRELWKRQLIIARRHKRPANFGFYSPAKDDADGDGSANRKRKKVSRLAAIESEEESTYVVSDLESVSCDNEMQNKEENIASDDGAEIVDLMNHVEHLKREHSILWLRVFKEWMDNASETFVDGNIYGGATLHPGKDNYTKNKMTQPHLGESSRYISDSVQASGDESSTIILESDNSFAGMGRVDLRQDHYKPYLHEGASSVILQAKSSPHDTLTTEGLRMVENVSKSPLTSVDDITDFYLSAAYPVSPPHYQEGILQRRHNLVEEILQLSAESYSVASSDSNTSCSDDDICNYGTSMPEVDQLLHDEYVCSGAELHSSSNPFEDKYDDEIAHSVSQEADWLEKKNRRKHTRRVITLLEDQNTAGETEASQKLNGNLNIDRTDNKKEQGKKTFSWNNVRKIYDKKHMVMTACTCNTGSMAKCSSPVRDDFVEDYFNKYVADSRSHETCMQYMFCCMLEQDSVYTEREVAVLRSSENKVFVFLFGVTFDRSETILSLLGCHKIEDVREVVVGLGLQVVRVSVETGVTYLFMTRSTEKSRQLLCTLQVCDSFSINDRCSLRSLEQVQVEFFEKQICGGSKVSLFQYSMVLFWCSNDKDFSLA